MPQAGDSYIVTVEEAHIKWGELRYTGTRDIIEGESYVKIPVKYARKYGITRGSIYNATFTNGTPSIQIKAAGNGTSDGTYAKQFEGIGHGACKAFTPWYMACEANVGDKVKVEFTSSRDVMFTLV